MQCINKCGKELIGRQKQFCSDRCRMQYKRDKPEQNSKVEQPEPEQTQVEQPTNFGLPNCACKHCQANRANGNKHTLNHGAYKRSHEIGQHELNRVSLLGDVDYKGVMSETVAQDEAVNPLLAGYIPHYGQQLAPKRRSQ